MQANVVHIAPRVSGKIQTALVQNQQFVKKGQLLFTIDPAPYVEAVNKAKALLANTVQQVKAAQSAVATARSLVAERKAQLMNAQQNHQRVMSLVKSKLYPVAQGDIATNQLKIAQAALDNAKNQLNQAIQQLGKSGDANASIRAAKATLASAQLQLQYTKVYAPANGYVESYTLQVGSAVSAYQELFAIVKINDWWVSANFRETDIERIRMGQSATIKIDMYPNHIFKGKVVSISAGSGTSFALLPPENATGNWVKVTQRFPVRIHITNSSTKFPLRIGATSTVTINTRS